MNDIAIRCENLGKQYRIGERERYKALRDTIADTITAPFRRLKSIRNPKSEIRNQEFWALKDVSFEVKRGEVVGIIGRNGAGKSTLLKILSRITTPTEGEVKLNGRIGSLLEVGTGFHPELTGRENIFLNGAILGMKKVEIARKFDEIVAFADIEKFIDTPVKRYSSGMYVRLAFAVAAHLEPEILIVDEVLAVGDAAFQKKCLGQMKKVSREGRTVLFVSHQMSAISQLCSRVVLLKSGQLVADDAPRKVLSLYLQDGLAANLRWTPQKKAEGAFRYNYVEVMAKANHHIQNIIHADSDITIVFDYEVRGPLPPGRLAFYLTNKEGQIVLSSASTDETPSLNQTWTKGSHLLECHVPGHFLSPSRYYLTISEPTENNADVIHESIIGFDVSELNSIGARDGRIGIVMPILRWNN